MTDVVNGPGKKATSTFAFDRKNQDAAGRVLVPVGIFLSAPALALAWIMARLEGLVRALGTAFAHLTHLKAVGRGLGHFFKGLVSPNGLPWTCVTLLLLFLLGCALGGLAFAFYASFAIVPFMIVLFVVIAVEWSAEPQ